MSTSKLSPCLRYGLGHSKQYIPSIVSSFLAERDDDGHLVKLNSDKYLLLRQQNLQQIIGVDSIRNYLSTLTSIPDSEPVRADLTDDELFGLIPPSGVNNLTTQYEYMQHIKKNHTEVKKRYEDLAKKKKEYEDFIGQYKTS